MGSYTRLHRGSLDTINGKLLPIDKTGLVAYYPFWQNSGTTLYDESKNGNDGTIYGATWNWSANFSKPYLSFDGTDDYVSLGDPAILEPTDAVTVAFWFKSTQGYSSAEQKSAVRHNGHFTPLQLNQNGPGRAVVFIGGNFYTATFDWTNWNGGSWHFYVAWFDSGTGTKVFIDDMATAVGTDATTGTLDTTTDPWQLGRAEFNAEYFAISLSNLFIFNKALTQSERVALYNKTK